MTTGVRRAETESDREDALAVRREVFVEEQEVPEDIEVDGKDDEAIHFVGYVEPDSESGSELDPDSDDPRPVATCRLRLVGDAVGKVERMAVRKPYRGEGWGHRLMAEVEATAEARGVETLTMHAQVPVEGFYRELGYETTSEVFEEAGIEHVEMEKSLA